MHCFSTATATPAGKLDVGRPQPLKELAEDFRHLSYLWIFTLTLSVGNLASLAYVEAWLMARTNIACIGWKSTEVSIRAEQKPRPILPAVSVRPHPSDSQFGKERYSKSHHDFPPQKTRRAEIQAPRLGSRGGSGLRGLQGAGISWLRGRGFRNSQWKVKDSKAA